MDNTDINTRRQKKIFILTLQESRLLMVLMKSNKKYSGITSIVLSSYILLLFLFPLYNIILK